MALLLTILISIVCVLLILIILIQKPKGGGLGSSFGGGSANLLGGVQKTNKFLDQATWGLAIALLVLVLATNVGSTGATTSEETLPESSLETDGPGVNFETPPNLPSNNSVIEQDLNTEDQDSE